MYACYTLGLIVDKCSYVGRVEMCVNVSVYPDVRCHVFTLSIGSLTFYFWVEQYFYPFSSVSLSFPP